MFRSRAVNPSSNPINSLTGILLTLILVLYQFTIPLSPAVRHNLLILSLALELLVLPYPD